jgi:hypothetical protein
MTPVEAAALGCRVKSGRAAAVLLVGRRAAPAVRACEEIQLCDPGVPESRQPYHAAFGTLETDTRKIERRVQHVRAAAERSVASLLAAYRAQGLAPRSACLVVGSLVEPSTIANPHIRAHALEGRLFRTVLEEALGAHGITSRMLVERDALAEGAALLEIGEVELKRRLTDLGSSLGRWRADEKLAALGAWMALASR